MSYSLSIIPYHSDSYTLACNGLRVHYFSQLSGEPSYYVFNFSVLGGQDGKEEYFV